MTKVVSLQQYKESQQPHKHGTAICMNCKHEWEYVRPLDDNEFMECPACFAIKGHAKFDVWWEQYNVWQCNCGCQLMRITPEGAYCANCGQWKND